MFTSFFSWDMGEFDEYNHWEFLFYQSNFIAILLPDRQSFFLHLLCCEAFAVKDHGFIPRASHLQQSRPVNNPG